MKVKGRGQCNKAVVITNPGLEMCQALKHWRFRFLLNHQKQLNMRLKSSDSLLLNIIVFKRVI